ncbi:MAG: protein kinase [Candidatus Aminicenantes bacterium]|nr:protein kinase [Candidatus Aminicenantes bacterium]
MKCSKCQFDNPPESLYCNKCGTQIKRPEKAMPPTETLYTPLKELTRGTTFSKRYEVIEELGRGGMAKVYRVIDKKIEEEVALKLMNPEIASDEETVHRFRNELKFARKIAHRNVCKMYDLSEEKGNLYITMEYVPGEDLKSLIRRIGQYTVGKAVSVGRQVCEGLTEAHRLGVMHRDLKPQNIMIDREGNARIMDFGIARSLKAQGITDKGVIIGTPEYMSPEQVEGKDVDHRSDIYALGVILYEMVTGRVPFEGHTPLSVALKQRTEVPLNPRERNPQVPLDLSRVILKCLEKDKNNRYQKAEELLSELRRIEEGIPSTEKIFPARKLKTEKIKRAVGRKAVLFGGAAVLLVLIFVASFYLFIGRQGMIDSIAVLPLKNLSGALEQEYFVDGMTEELISNLTQIGGLERVISSTSVLKYKNTQKSLPEIGRELNVDAVVEGSVLTSGNRVRITAKLIEARTDRTLWSKSYERPMSDILTLQSELARAITKEIKVVVKPEEQALLASARQVNPEAYQLTLKGRFYWNKRTEEGLKRAREFFEEAIEKDPDYALAYAGLADTYNMFGSYHIMPAHEAYPKAKEAALKALEIDENLAEAYTSLAFEKYHYEWDWFGAESDFNWAFGLNPSYASAHSWYAAFLTSMGRFEEALTAIRRSQELDPLSLPIGTTIGASHYYAGQYDQAIEQCQKALEIDPNFPWAYTILANANVQKSLFKEAIAELQRAVELSGGSFEYLAILAHAHAVAGERNKALRILNELREQSKQKYVPSYETALIYVGLGEEDQAFEFLEKAVRERSDSLRNIKVDPRLESLHDDPRFSAVLKKMGLE